MIIADITPVAPPGAAAVSPASLEQHIDVETPEQVVLSYTVAGVGTRAAAALIDQLVMWGFIIAVYLLLLLPSWLGNKHTATPQPSRTAVAWALAIVGLMVFAIQWGYYVVFEAIWDGQTPGKRALHIRVVQDGGYSVGFGASAVRNLVRVIDMQPGFVYAVGIIAVVLSKTGKRLGDMVAGTFIVQERIERKAAAASPADGAAPEGALPAVAALSDDEYELLGRFLERHATLDVEHRMQLEAQLGERFRAVLPDSAVAVGARLQALYERERAARQQGVAARGATGAAREHYTLVARSSPRWTNFAAALARAQAHGLAALPEEEVSEFVAQYRDVATDLARLKTAARGHDSDALFYVSRLVAAGHNLLYRQRRLTAGAVWRFVAGAVPREIRRSWAYVLIAAGCLFIPVGVTYHAVVRDPALVSVLVPPAMVDRANEGVVRARAGDRTYVEIKDYLRPIAASRIISNNVSVTYATFALGITAGIGTIAMLIFNGISIGAVLGLYATKGIIGQIGEFVIPHSVFELSAICIAGGGGLLIAAALLLPGAMTRREAIVINGRRAIRLIAASTLLLLMAGTLEGLISPRTDIPIGVKLAIAAGCAVLLLVYILFGGRGMTDVEPGERYAYSDARAFNSR